MAETSVKPPVKSKARKKKQKRNVVSGEVHVQATFNNTIITVTDTNGNTLTSASAGASGFRGSKKGTAYAAQIASEKAVSDAATQFGMKKAEVYVKGVGLGRDSAIRAMQAADIQVNAIHDVTGIPHGGVRPRKQRRG